MKPAAWIGILLLIPPASAHDLIAAESVQSYLASLGDLQKVIASKEPPARRAQAHLDLGKMLDEIRELLNRDLDAHGRVQGLPSNLLMSELEARGAGLAYSPETNRFLADPRHYREALKLTSADSVAADASFRLLQGHFYDSFTVDPLRAAQTPAQLAGQIGLGEEFLKKYPQHPAREEASFILAIHYVQAARVANDAQRRMVFARRARQLADEFIRTYPGSLRAPALPPLLQGLPGNGPTNPEDPVSPR